MTIAELRAVVLDTPDPRKLAEFYRALVGGEITYDDGEWVKLRDGGFVIIECRRYTKSRQKQEQVAGLAYRILDALARGDVVRRDLTVPEGRSLDEIAQLVVAEGMSLDAFLAIKLPT